MRRIEVVALLKRFGHSAQKALEIAIDFERGDKHAVEWVRAIKKMEPTA